MEIQQEAVEICEVPHASKHRSCIKVLVLGDGDFSFSLSFAQALVHFQHSDSCCVCGEVQLHATSFDAYDALCDKYVQVQKTLALLASRPVLRSKQQLQICSTTVSVAVQHGVDATNVHETLQPTVRDQPFDIVIFNFPHLSTEDARLHSQMLAHIMHSCTDSRVLREGGALYITLADLQPRNWRIDAMAQRTNMCIDRRLSFLSGAFEGYTSQRHNGRTFRHRVEEAFMFVLRREGEAITSPRVLETIMQSYEAALVRPVETEAERKNATEAKEESEALPLSKKQGKKRKHDSEEAMANIERTQGDKFRCILCDKSFGTIQGAKTHAHMVHALKRKADGSEPDGARLTFCCEICGKACADAEGLQQHMVARHTGTSAKQTRQASARSDPNPQMKHGCEICGAVFAVEEDLHRHGRHGFVPIEKDPLHCVACGKRFPDERALLQHTNFCAHSGEKGEPDTAAGGAQQF